MNVWGGQLPPRIFTVVKLGYINMASYFSSEPPGSFVVTLNHLFCTGCGVCISVCPNNMFRNDKDGRVAVVPQDSCKGCLRCYTECPVHALRVYPLKMQKSLEEK